LVPFTNAWKSASAIAGAVSKGLSERSSVASCPVPPVPDGPPSSELPQATTAIEPTNAAAQPILWMFTRAMIDLFV